MKIYIDFDNTLVDSVTAFVSRYNALSSKKFNSDNITKYNFEPLHVSGEEIVRGFNSDYFFSELKLYPNVVESLTHMKELGGELIFLTRGTLKNISKKITWLEEHHWVKDLFSSFVFMTNNSDVTKLDMKDSILIDDLRINHLNTDAKYRFAFRDLETREWFPVPDDGVKIYSSWRLLSDDICTILRNRYHKKTETNKNTDTKKKNKTRYYKNNNKTKVVIK